MANNLIGTAYIQVAPNMTGIQGKIASGLKGSGSNFADQFGTEISGRSAAIVGAIAGVASAAASKAMNLIANSVGDAVSRVDTLARFPTVMANLGYSAKDASAEVKRIATSLVGLPTSLDSLTTFVQRIAPVSGGLKQATDLALAFNNAVLAGGGPVSRQADAIEQFSQMLSKGKPDMMAWRTLQEAMPATLGQIAKQLGITSGNTQDLYDQLANGTISFEQFTGAITSLNQTGLPGFKNFADQAKDSTKGIATGWQNLQTAITRGLATIIQAIGQQNISQALSAIGKGFETALKAIVPAINFIAKYKDIFAPIAVGVAAIVTAFTAWYAILKIMTVAQAIFNAVLTANPIGLIIVAIAGLVAALVFFFTKTELGQKIFQGFLNVVKGVFSWISANWGLLLSILLGPFGLAITLIIKNFDTLKAVVVGAFNVIKNTVMSVVSWIMSNWQLLLGILLGPIGVAAGLIIRNLETIKGAFVGAFNFVTGLWGRLSGFFGSVANNIRNAFGGMTDVGRNIVQGIWNGINSLGGWLRDRIVAFVREKIPGPIRQALGIRSPSKVAAALGEQVPRGLAAGITATSNLVSKAANSMADKAIVGMSTPLVDSGFNTSSPLATSSPTGDVSSRVTNIENVYLGDASAVQEFFKQQNQDTFNASSGLTLNQGTI